MKQIALMIALVHEEGAAFKCWYFPRGKIGGIDLTVTCSRTVVRGLQLIIIGWPDSTTDCVWIFCMLAFRPKHRTTIQHDLQLQAF